MKLTLDEKQEVLTLVKDFAELYKRCMKLQRVGVYYSAWYHGVVLLRYLFAQVEEDILERDRKAGVERGDSSGSA